MAIVRRWGIVAVPDASGAGVDCMKVTVAAQLANYSEETRDGIPFELCMAGCPKQSAVTVEYQEEVWPFDRLIAVAMVAVLALAMPAFAAQTKAATAKTMTISGTLQKVDGQTLTVQTPKGSETVMMEANAQIRRAGKTLPISDLGSESGSRVTIRYMENNGQKMARV